MYYLYPRISKTYAVQLAKERVTLTVEELSQLSQEFSETNSWYAPVGGLRIDNAGLLEIQRLLRKIAADYGYPSVLRSKDSGSFDKDCAKTLYENMRIHPLEASSLGLWMYLTVVLVPDLVRWRFSFGNEATSLDRYIGSARGLRRNMLGRLWWRSHLFYYALNRDDPYVLLSVLSEDDQIQISERPSLSGNPRLAKEVAIGYLTAQRIVERQRLTVERRLVLRDALKRLSRIVPITMLDMLDEDESQRVIDGIFRQSIDSLILAAEEA